MKFNLSNFMWEYQSPSVGSGAQSLWGPYDIVRGGELFSATQQILQNSVSIPDPSGWVDLLGSMSILGNSDGYEDKRYPHFVKNAGGTLVDISKKAIFAGKEEWPDMLADSALGGAIQSTTSDNFFFNTVSTNRTSIDHGTSVGTVFRPTGGWLGLPSGGNELTYTYDNNIGGVIQKLDGNTIGILSPEQDPTSSSFYIFNATYGFSVRAAKSLVDSDRHGFTAEIPTSMTLHGFIRQKPIEDCPNCTNGFNSSAGKSCRSCFGTGKLGITQGQREFVPILPSGYSINFSSSSPDRFIDSNVTGGIKTEINNLFDANAQSALVVLSTSNGKYVLGNTSDTTFSTDSSPLIQSARTPITKRAVKGLYDYIVNNYNDFKPGITNITAEQALGFDPLLNHPYSGAVYFNYSTQNTSPGGVEWPANKLGFTPIQSKHWEPFANLFTRAYTAYYSEETRKAYVHDVTASVKTSGSVEFEYSIIDEGSWQIKGYEWTDRTGPFRAKTAFERHNPGYFLWVPSGLGEVDDIVRIHGDRQLNLVPNPWDTGVTPDGNTYFLMSSGVIRGGWDEYNGTLNPTATTIAGGIKFTNICNSELEQRLICVQEDGDIGILHLAGASGAVIATIPGSGIQDLVHVPRRADLLPSQFASIGHAEAWQETYGVPALWMAKMGDREMKPVHLRTKKHFWTQNNSDNIFSICIGDMLVWNYADHRSFAMMRPSVSITDVLNKNDSSRDLTIRPGWNFSPYSGDDDSEFTEAYFNDVVQILYDDDNEKYYAITWSGVAEIDFENKKTILFRWKKDSIDSIKTFYDSDSSLTTSAFRYDGDNYLYMAKNSSTANNKAWTITFVENVDGSSANFGRIEAVATETTLTVSASANPRTIKHVPGLNTYQVVSLTGTSQMLSSDLSTVLGTGVEGIYIDTMDMKLPGGVNIQTYNPSFHTLGNDGSISSVIQINTDPEFLFGPSITTDQDITFMISAPDIGESTMPFFGAAYSYATSNHVLTRSIPDNNLLGKMVHRSGSDIIDLEMGSTFSQDAHEIIKTVDGNGLPTSSGIFYLNRMINNNWNPENFAEIKDGDLEASVRGKSMNDYYYGQELIRPDFSYSPMFHFKQLDGTKKVAWHGSSGLVIGIPTATGISTDLTYTDSLYVTINNASNKCVSASGTSPFVWGSNNIYRSFQTSASGINWPFSYSETLRDALQGVYQPSNFTTKKSIHTYAPYFKTGYKALPDYIDTSKKPYWLILGSGHGNNYATVSTIEFSDLLNLENRDNFYNRPLTVETLGAEHTDLYPERVEIGLISFIQRNTDGSLYVNGKLSNPITIPNYLGACRDYLWGKSSGSGLQAYDPNSGAAIPGLIYFTPDTDIQAINVKSGIFGPTIRNPETSTFNRFGITNYGVDGNDNEIEIIDFSYVHNKFDFAASRWTKQDKSNRSISAFRSEFDGTKELAVMQVKGRYYKQHIFKHFVVTSGSFVGRPEIDSLLETELVSHGYFSSTSGAVGLASYLPTQNITTHFGNTKVGGIFSWTGSYAHAVSGKNDVGQWVSQNDTFVFTRSILYGIDLESSGTFSAEIPMSYTLSSGLYPNTPSGVGGPTYYERKGVSWGNVTSSNDGILFTAGQGPEGTLETTLRSVLSSNTDSFVTDTRDRIARAAFFDVNSEVLTDWSETGWGVDRITSGSVPWSTNYNPITVATPAIVNIPNVCNVKMYQTYRRPTGAGSNYDDITKDVRHKTIDGTDVYSDSIEMSESEALGGNGTRLDVDTPGNSITINNQFNTFPFYHIQAPGSEIAVPLSGVIPLNVSSGNVVEFIAQIDGNNYWAKLDTDGALENTESNISQEVETRVPFQTSKFPFHRKDVYDFNWYYQTPCLH